MTLLPSAARYPAYAKYLPTLGCISVIPVPGVVLPPGVRHAAVLTVRARTTTGDSLVAAPELARIAAQPAGARSTPVDQLYGDALDRLVATAAVMRKSDVASVAVFTTSGLVFELPQLRARLRQQPDPQLILDPVAAVPYSVAVFGIGVHPSLPAILPNWNPTHVFKSIVPALREAGVPQGQIDAMLTDNPRRFFGG
jgi:phosphotriesterase family protein